MLSNFRFQTIVTISGKLVRKIPVAVDALSSHEHKIYPNTNTSLIENSIEFEIQTDRNYYNVLSQTYLASKLKFVYCRGYKTHNIKELKKKHKEKAKADEEPMVMEEDEEAPFPLGTQLNNNLHSICSNVEVYTNSQQIYNSNGFYAYKSYFSNEFNGAISEYKGVLLCEVYDYEEFPDKIMEVPLSEPFFRRSMEMLSRPDGFMLYGKLGVDFFSTYELLYPNLKIRLRLMRARTNFHLTNDNPIVSVRTDECLLYTRRIALKADSHRKRMDMLAYTL